MTSHIGSPRSRLEIRLARSLGTYQIVAALWGIFAVLDYGPKFIARLPEALHLKAAALLGSIGLVFVVLLVAGILLARGSRGAWPLTLALQAAQVPLWSTASTAFLFFGGVYTALIWGPTGWGYDVGLKANIQLGFAPDSTRPVFVGLNLVPLAVLALLAWDRTRTRAAAAGVTLDGSQEAVSEETAAK